MKYEDETRAISLADAAGRAASSGLNDLADKLVRAAEDLLIRPRVGIATFEIYARSKGHSIERRREEYRNDYAYMSVGTSALYDCWLAAGGPPTKC